MRHEPYDWEMGEFYPGEFDDVELGPESPYFDGYDEDGTEYYPDPSEKLNHQKNCSDGLSGEVEDWDRVFELAEVIDTVRLKGQGKGKQIVGSMAVLLEGEEEYGFEVKFWRLDDSVELPEGWEK